MSRTQRTNIDLWTNKVTVGGDAYRRHKHRSRKLAPYQIHRWEWKETGATEYRSPSKRAQLVAENANRAKKKALRAIYRAAISKDLNDYINQKNLAKCI